jgi:hypothetical protein
MRSRKRRSAAGSGQSTIIDTRHPFAATQPCHGIDVMKEHHFQIEVNIAYNFTGWENDIIHPQNIFKVVALAEAFFSEN